MKLDAKQILRRLGRGDSIVAVCENAGLTREQFDDIWHRECRSRLSPAEGTREIPGLRDHATITRDRRGVPHVEAKADDALFFAYGYAVAQDRLFQLDFLRRRANGELSEILGEEAIEQDLLSRTIGLARIAAQESAMLPAETSNLLRAYANGINACCAS